MKKKLIISIVLCMLAIFAFSFAVSAEDAACEHEYDSWTVTLGENGFLGEITASAKCTSCKETATEIIPKIFITKGYSNSNDGIMQDYGVNREALAKYEALSGEKLKFGAVVALKDSIGGKNPLDNEGEPISSKVKSFDYTETEYSVISVSIKGIPENVKASSGLLCALYINAGGRTTYLDNCAEKEVCGTKTFDEIEAVPEKDVTELEKVEIIDGTRYHQMTIEEMGLVARKYWNSKSSYTTDDTSKKFFGTKSFTKEDLPNGTIIYIENKEWQYRPHKWYQAGNATRPLTTKDEYTKVDDSWWYDSSKNVPYDHVGFNISYYNKDNPTENVSSLGAIYESYTVEQIAEIFKIYVPVAYVEENVGGGDSGTTDPDTPVNPPVDPNPGEGGNEGGTTDPNPDQGGNEGGTTDPNPDQGEDDDVTVPELPDYSAEKQDWQDDGVLKILAIGNSFSDDSMQYVYQVAKDAGIENIKLGKLYIGGCSLATHLANAKANKSAYDYKTNTSGTWDAQGNKSIKFAVESDDWDFITFQQVSGQSGIASTYDDLYELIKIVEPLNPSARLAWHMTWAYQKGSGHSDFGKYNKDQMTMYNAIVSAVNTKILPVDNIEIVIPAGTAIQNVRTSFIGDTLTRDGYHLSNGIGRYIAAMAYVKALTGLSIDNSKTCPSDVDSGELMAIIECVNNAYKTPFAVTESTYNERPQTPAPEVPDTPVVDGEVVIPEGYRQLTLEEMGWQAASFWNGKVFDYNPDKDFNKSYYGTVNSFTKEDIPIGSIIILKQGENWQYRPDGWGGSGSRPGNVKTEKVVVDEAWWNGYTTRGFNLSKTNSAKINTMTPEEIYKVLVILVPVSESEGGGTTEPENPPVDPTPEPEEPKDPLDGLVRVEYMDWLALSYWNPTESVNHSIRITTASNSNQFWSTRTFTKEQLPVGSVIIVESGSQYRVLSWTTFGQKGTRSSQITTNMIVIDEAWWGSNTVKAFNISYTSSANMSAVTEDQINAMFKIYVPESAADANKAPTQEEPETPETPDTPITPEEPKGTVSSSDCVEEITVIDGKEYRALTIEAMGLIANAYYYSDKKGPEIYETGTSGTPSNYYATKLFTDEYLANGTVLWVKSGYQYRPEGWDDTGASPGGRPGNVKTTYVTIDDNWHGVFTVRGFNISKTSGNLLNTTAEAVYECFKIYIPVENIAD